MEPNSKSQLRSQLLNKRRSLSLEIWQQQSQELSNQLAASDLIHNAKVILGFISFRQEPDLSSLFQEFPDKTWGFPRCNDKNLEWYQVNPLNFSESFEVGSFGILEPIRTLPKIDLNIVDVILVPAIAIDEKGYRLGYGGGFYDRFLITQTGFTVGVVFADFLFKKVPTQAWDLPVKSVCTQNEIYLSELLEEEILPSHLPRLN